MARRSKSDEKLIGLAIMVGGPIWLFKEHPGIAILVLFVIVMWSISAFRNSSCSLCGTELKRKVYFWKIDNKKHRVCPNCNRSLERKASKTAISKL
jgi:hypothetical protein